jgi:hypothetical protein
MTQRELNKLYELPDMRIAYKYAYIAKTLAMTLFYLPIFPMGFIISFVGFILGYFLELFNFSHTYKRPQMIDEIITKFYADYFIVILFIGSIGDYFFFHDIFPSNTFSLISIIIFGVLIIIPYSKFITCNFVGINKSDYHNFPLPAVYFTFYNDYQRQNPFTKKVGLLNYLTELRRRGYLSNNAFQIAEDNIDYLNIMEIYYGVSKGHNPIMQRSVITEDDEARVITGPNLKQTVIVPEINDNELQKVRKQKYFDSQVIQMFGSALNRRSLHPNLLPIGSITEEENSQTKDNIINEEPITGVGTLPFDIPLSESVKKI